jgi:MerR family redox-sensitive transcriptional activator SoxR
VRLRAIAETQKVTISIELVSDEALGAELGDFIEPALQVAGAERAGDWASIGYLNPSSWGLLASVGPQPRLRSRWMSEAELSIGEVAESAGVSISAIRYYERSGLLPKAERVGGQRRFAADTVRRLEVIGVAKRAGFSLAEIRALLTSVDEGAPVRGQLRALAARRLPEVDAEIERAQQRREWLAVAGACACQSLDDCGLFDSTLAPG